MSAAPIMAMPVRRAQASDVDDADLSRCAVHVYRQLCEHRNANNECWPKIETQARKLHYSPRTIIRARNELLEIGWICFPEGDSGGRAESKEDWEKSRGNAVKIRLHPDGRCNCPKAELKQRTAAS